MTTEAEAQARLLAHYEDKLAMLKANIVALAKELVITKTEVDRRACLSRVEACEAEIMKIESDVALLRAATNR